MEGVLEARQEYLLGLAHLRCKELVRSGSQFESAGKVTDQSMSLSLLIHKKRTTNQMQQMR